MAYELKQIYETEPPGPRRVILALKAKGSSMKLVAETCNCDKAVVTRVARGLNTNELHGRIKAVVADVTGLPEAWLFDQPTATQQPGNINHKSRTA